MPRRVLTVIGVVVAVVGAVFTLQGAGVLGGSFMSGSGTWLVIGIAMVVAARRGLPIALHTPSEVKAAVSGSGRAPKAQVGAMVTRILRLESPPKPADAADALALAITHIWRGGAQARIDAALAAAGGSGRLDRRRAGA